MYFFSKKNYTRNIFLRLLPLIYLRILSFQGKNSCLNAGYSVSGDGMYALPAVYFTSAGRAPPSRMPFSTASHMSL